MAKWALIYNPVAGGFNTAKLESIQAALRNLGIEAVLLPTRQPGHATGIARALEGVERVAVFGGDGTLNEAAGGLLGRGMPLVFLPGGSGNSMARELGLPKDPAAAARALAGPHTLSFRPGKVDGRHFLLMAGFGFDGLAIHLISKNMKNRLGPLGYILTGFRCLVHRHPSMWVETPEGKRRGLWVVAARGQHYAGILKIHPTAGLTRPGLGLTAVNGWMLLPFGIGRLLFRLPVRGPGLVLEEHPSFRITSQTPVHVHLDGDYFKAATSFEVGIAEQELLLSVPGKI